MVYLPLICHKNQPKWSGGLMLLIEMSQTPTANVTTLTWETTTSWALAWHEELVTFWRWWFSELPVWWDICVAWNSFFFDWSPAVENGTKGGHESTCLFVSCFFFNRRIFGEMIQLDYIFRCFKPPPSKVMCIGYGMGPFPSKSNHLDCWRC